METKEARLSSISASRVQGWLAPVARERHKGSSIVVTLEEREVARCKIPEENREGGGKPWRFTLDLGTSLLARDFPRIGVAIENGPAFPDSPLHAAPQPAPQVSFTDLSEAAKDDEVPPLDRDIIDERGLSENQETWRRDGALILPGFLPDDLVEAYKRVRWELRPNLESWSCPVVYMHIPECKALCLYRPLTEILEELIGEPMGVNLTLTGWKSTERNWHQDDYLNPPSLNSRYLAVWMALEDIDPDCGLFEYVPGSHRWPSLRGSLVRDHLLDHEKRRADWPFTSERFLVPACEAEIDRRGASIKRFEAKKGDVLIWHGKLLHRGSRPKTPEQPRRALIAHYSSINHRPDFPAAQRDENGSWFFPIDLPLA